MIMNNKEDFSYGDFPSPTLSQVESALEEREGSDRRQNESEDLIKERRRGERRSQKTDTEEA